MCVYLDDILVTGATEQEHLANLTQVLQRLQDAGMRVKCAFLVPSVAYLGHVISDEGLGTSEAKVEAIVDAPHPRTSPNSVHFWVWLIIMVNSCPISQPSSHRSTSYCTRLPSGIGVLGRRKHSGTSRSC